MKRFHLLKKNKGFTLAEMMMSLLLLTIIIVISAGIIVMSGNIFAKNVILTDVQSEADDICRLLSDKIRCASSLRMGSTISGTSEGYRETLIVSQDGSRVALNNSVFSESTVLFEHTGDDDRKIKITINANSYSARGAEITVSIYSDKSNLLEDKPLYKITRSAFPLNRKIDSTAFDTGEYQSSGGGAFYISCTYID